MRGERRVVTVLFCDVKGSTTIAETLDPEEWAEIMNEAFAHLIGPIERYEGLVARLMGDAVLAFFGAPVAHEDDPERAVLAALEIVSAAGTYRERLRAERGLADFDVRIGINTGLAVLGDVGKGVAVEYTALGDAVNVAARVQAAAGPGQILVTDASARLLGDAFELEGLGAVEVKGRSQPVRMLRVLGRRTGPLGPSGRRPFVDREAEIRSLEDAAAAVREGQGRIVTLVAEAGLGKTRLIDEIRHRAPDLQWFEARAQSYGGARPFLLFRDHLLAWCGARPGEALDAVREKLREAVSAVAPDQAEATGIVELVAGLSAGDPGPAGDELRKRIHRIVGLLARREAERAPAVIVFDDLQWSDAASADLVGELLAITDEVPALLLLSFRPDRRSVAWRVRQRVEAEFPHRHVDIALAPLAPADAEALLGQLLGDRFVPARLRQGILSKAEGNPLFLEQFARALGDVDPASTEVALPDTLVSLLASRLDRLEQPSRHALQAASVIGRMFGHGILAEVAQADGRLDRDLIDLQRADLIKEEQRIPERVYSFRHALVQEVAYGSLLQRRRRELHGRVAEILERTSGGEEISALIGHHWAEAVDMRAVPHLRAAAHRALRLHAIEDAIDLCDSALAVARKVGAQTADLCDVYTDRGRALELRADFDGALATYEEMERVGKERADRAMELRALSHRITVYATPTARGDLGKARELVDRAIPAARELGDRALLARILWSAMHAYAWSREELRAAEAGQEALGIARELGLKELEAYASLDVTRYTRFQKGWGSQLDTVRRASDLFRELGNEPMVADTLSTLAIGHVCIGEYDDALRYSADGLALAERIHNLWNRSFSRFATPFIHFDRGDWGRAIAEWEDAVRLGTEAGFVAVQVGPAADLAWVYESAGDRERADRALDGAQRLRAERPDAGQWATWLDGVRARILISRGQLDEADGLVKSAKARGAQAVLPTGLAAIHCAAAELALARSRPAAAAEEAGAGVTLLESYGYVPMSDELLWLVGEAHRLAGRPDDARAAIARSQAVSAQLRAVRTPWRALLSLAQLSEGDTATAAALRDEAARIARDIAASLAPLGLADRFLARAGALALPALTS